MTRPAHLLIIVVGLVLASCGDRGEVASSAKTSAPAATATAAPAYHATLEEGIAFSKSGYPDFVAKVEGISIVEPFGRWTDGPVAAVELKEPLPKQFDLVLLGAAYGPNIGQPVRVTIGSATQSIVFDADLTNGAQTRRLAFNLDAPAKRIEFLIPHPAQPSNGDLRKLGIAMVELKIEASK